MKQSYFFMLMLFCFVMIACNRGPCRYDEVYPCDNFIVLPSMYKLTPKNYAWLENYKVGQSFVLENGKGFSTPYRVIKKDSLYSDIQIDSKPIVAQCCGSPKEYTQISVKSEYVTINGDGALGPIVLYREKYFNSSVKLKDSSSYDNIPELLKISVLNSSANFNPDDTTSRGDISYRDTITLLGNLYNNIHVIYARYSYGQIKAYEFYYSRQKGFIGVKLTNDEVWILK